MQLARLLAQQDAVAAEDPRYPVCSSTIFQRDEIVVRLIDVLGDVGADPGLSLGLADRARAAEMSALLDEAAVGADGAALENGDFARFLAFARMEPITDRRSSPDA
jgi:hypothetical protein